MWPGVSLVVAAMIVVLGVLLVWKISKDRKAGFPMRDERTAKITGRAATYALYLGSYFILAFLFILIIGTEFYGLPEVEAGYPLIAVLLVYTVSFAMLRWYFGRTGE